MSSDFANHLQTAYEGLEDESIQITEEIAEFEEYLQFLKDRQTEIADAVSSSGEISIDQFLGTVAMRICDDESELAVNFLSEHFGASKTRARYCVSLAISDLAFNHENSYANFHGYDIEDEHWSSISEMNYLFHNGTCHYGPDESLQNLSEDLTDLLEFVDSSLPFNDKPSLLLLAGIAAGFPSPEFALSQSLPPTTPYAYDAFLEDRTRFLCLSFAIYCAQKSRVRDSFERQPAKKTDWLKATPWLLPLVDGSNNSALDLLLETVDKLGYSYIEPGEILFKNSAHIGRWKVTFDPATGSRIESPRRLTTTGPPVVTTTLPPVVTPQISSDALSKTSITLASNTASNAIYWTVNLTDAGGRLPTTAGAQLCAPGSSPGLGPWCTGAIMSRSGTAYSASYTGLFLISSAADRGSWYPSVFWPVGQTPEFQIAGSSRVMVQ